MSSGIDPAYLSVLREIRARLRESSVQWAVTGSLGLALQGVPVEVHDIDLLTDEAGAYEVERRFADSVTQKVRFSTSAKIRSHFGALTINGIRVEIIGDAQTRRADGKWERGWDLNQHTRVAEVGGMQIPVLSLECEYALYRVLGRVEKLKVLRRWLQAARTKEDSA